jgi:hypothetical protein
VALSNQLLANLQLVLRRGRAVLPARLCSLDPVAAPVHDTATGRLAVGEAVRRLAEGQQLLRPRDRRSAARPPAGRPTRAGWGRGPRPRGDHPGASGRDRAAQPPDRRAGTPDPRSPRTPPRRRIFTSLPKAGMVRPATLLAEIGDVRGRFRTDDALAALAGVAPSTRRSGKLHAVSFRYACDKKLGLLRPPARRGSASAGCRDSEGPCRTGPSTADAP